MGRAPAGPISGTPRKLSSSAPGLCEENGWTTRAERYRVRENEAAIRAERIGDAAPGLMRA